MLKPIKIIQTLPLHLFYIRVVTPFLLLLSLLTPPFQVPDEPSHMYRAFQISQLNFLSEKKDDLLGGAIPKSIVDATKKLRQDIPFHEKNKFSLPAYKKEYSRPLLLKNTEFVSFPNTALYSPVAYIPQAIGLKFATLLNLSPLYLLWIARIVNLLTASIIIMYALKQLPLCTELFFLVAISPMFLFQQASLSADCITNALIFLFCSVCFKQIFVIKNLKPLSISIFLLLLLAFISLCKQTYICLGLLLFPIIWNAWFVTKERKECLQFLGALFLFLIPFFIWNGLIKNLYVPARSDIIISPERQMQYILNHPMNYLKIVFNTINNQFFFIRRSCFGFLGWLDAPIDIKHLRNFNWLLLFIAIFSKPKINLNVSLRLRFLFFATFVVTAFLIILSMYLSWNSVGDKIISGIQGRYFTAMVPLLLAPLANTFIAKKFGGNYTKLIAFGSFIYMASITIDTIVKRYYI